ncbi:hypothetical protein ACEWY4_018265 [Coilia grayii]|uniref:C2H2-type domain-containing protein n=1 Tax=Coilia grayii TaxID=363190 RepID=A0ABD1JJ61_9TELE
MTKTGKPDSYWRDLCFKYANGQFHFSTGKRPGAKKWKKALERIDSCPLHTSHTKDLFGRSLQCSCGFHKISEVGGVETEAGRVPVSTEAKRGGMEAGGGQVYTEARRDSTDTERGGTEAGGGGRGGTEAGAGGIDTGRGGTEAGAGGTEAGAAASVAVTGQEVQCYKCNQLVEGEHFSEHLSDHHTDETCDTCGAMVEGTIGLLNHIQKVHYAALVVPSPKKPLRPQKSTTLLPLKTTPLRPACSSATPRHSVPHSATPHHSVPHTPHSTSQLQCYSATNWRNFLPDQFRRVIQEADQVWIAKCLYEPSGQLRQKLSACWFHPPLEPKPSPPEPGWYHRQRLFIWAPMRMWGISLKCPQCSSKMNSSGIYRKVREVIDVDSRYYLVGGDYPRCSRCSQPVCPWSQDILSQIDVSNRSMFPAVLTTQLALDRKCMTFLKPRTCGNSSSYVQSAIEEAHSEEWARQSIRYLADCERHKKTASFAPSAAVHPPPLPFRPLPLAQWFETVHSNDILSHVDEMKGVITSTYGGILKMDSTKKITKKLAGGIGDSAAWMSNIGNEFGQVLNSVLTTGEGAGLEELCQGIVTRYKNAGQAEPDVIYVDQDCCSQSGVSPVSRLFRPWKSAVRLDSFHFMRRFNCGLTTEHHPLYGTFCAKLSSCVFEWDQEDVQHLKEAKRVEWKHSHSGRTPTEAQLLATISPGELKRHCRRRTRGVEEMRRMIAGLLESVWDLADTTGLRLVNHESMRHVWEVQQKHLDCLQDPPGVALYTKVGTLQKGGKDLDILRCARGSSSLESFHRHQCAFIPGWRCNAVHMQMYMLEGVSRWNMGRAKEAVDVEGSSNLRIFDVRLMSLLNSLSQCVLGYALVPEFTPPGKPTGERIAAEYLLAQTNRGDLLAPSQVSEVPLQVLDEEDEPDHTINIHDIICPSAEIGAGGDPGAVEGDAKAAGGDPGAVEGDAEAAGDIEHGPLATETSQCDSRGVVGWRAVDDLAAYLVGLNRKITALSAKEEAEIDPEVHRVTECVCLRLAKEFDQARNRPKDTKGKTLPIPQSIVSVYSHIRQLLQDSRVVLAQTTLALVPVNNTTVSSWLLRRDKRTDRDMLLQGTVLPKQLYLAKEPLPSSNTLPAAPVRHAHEEMTFEEPKNREGEAFPRQRTLAANKPAVASPPSPPPQFPPQFGPSQPPLFQHAPPFPHALPFPYAPPFPYMPFIHAPPLQHAHQLQQPPPFPGPPPLQYAPPLQHAPPFPDAPKCLPSQPRQRTWRLNNAAKEDEELVSRREPPRKRLSKETYHYTCKGCGKEKNKRTGHTQLKGHWFCPASGLTLDDWRKSVGL